MKFRYKLMLNTVSLLALFYAISACLLIMISFQFLLNKEQNSAVNTHRMIQNTLILSEKIDKEGLSDVLTQLEKGSDSGWVGIRLVNNLTEAVYYERGYFSNDIHPDDITRMMEERCYLVSFDSDSYNCYLRVMGLIQTNVTQFYLESYYDVTTIYDMRNSQLTIYNIVLIIILLLGSAVVYIVASRSTQSIGYLSKISRKLASGHLNIRADVCTGDEIEMLACDFNYMADKIESNIREMENTMQRQEEFMGSFAHELKTPMTSIIGYADLLRGGSLTEAESLEAANYIFSEGKRLESLSFKLLELIVLKNQTIEFKEVKMHSVQDDVIYFMRPHLAKKNITLDGECEDGYCWLEPDLIKSLLMNLIDNAAKAMENAGSIYIRNRKTKHGWEIEVMDNGRGMAPEDLSRITEAFYRVDKSRSRAQGGAGLGLALCSEIVQLHHGTMTFTSMPGKGTTVKVQINRLADESGGENE